MHEAAAKIKDYLGNKVISVEEKSLRRVYFGINPQDLLVSAEFIFKEMECRFITATGIDTPQGFEIIYHFSYDSAGVVISLRILLTDKAKPAIDSLALLITGAEWIEREMWELLGINFIGHPNLKHLLLIDEWPEGEFPLRHDKHQHTSTNSDKL